MPRIFRGESGLSAIGAIILIVVAGTFILVAVALTGSSQRSGKFRAAVKHTALDGIRKSSEEIRHEILIRADDSGVLVDEEDISITWGPHRHYLEIAVQYTVPINLGIYAYDREYAFIHRRELSGVGKIIDRVGRDVRGSYDKMLDRVQKTTEDR